MWKPLFSNLYDHSSHVEIWLMWKLLSDQSRNDYSTVLVGIVAIIWKPAFTSGNLMPKLVIYRTVKSSGLKCKKWYMSLLRKLKVPWGYFQACNCRITARLRCRCHKAVSWVAVIHNQITNSKSFDTASPSSFILWVLVPGLVQFEPEVQEE